MILGETRVYGLLKDCCQRAQGYEAGYEASGRHLMLLAGQVRPV